MDDKLTSSYKSWMARPKTLTEKTIVRFPDQTFDRIDRLLMEAEDRTSFIRTAVLREIDYRNAGLHKEVKRILLADESESVFAADAVKRAVQNRRSLLLAEKSPGEQKPTTGRDEKTTDSY
ncbi:MULTISPECIES: hypothetical protein [Acidiphilium]|uniref:hypothetical protein n=1 Tax=Acidiphilium TaxID=522 RepID=UPI00257DE9AD|nr:MULTISPECIES: hypothetical protein [Acidiphilium]HQT84937.1 hypothetical protein [Acidiphilium rubrum]